MYNLNSPFLNFSWQDLCEFLDFLDTSSLIPFVVDLFISYSYFSCFNIFPWLIFKSWTLHIMSFKFLLVFSSRRLHSSVFFVSRLNFHPVNFNKLDSSSFFFTSLKLPGHLTVAPIVVRILPSVFPSSLFLSVFPYGLLYYRFFEGFNLFSVLICRFLQLFEVPPIFFFRCGFV